MNEPRTSTTLQQQHAARIERRQSEIHAAELRRMEHLANVEQARIYTERSRASMFDNLGYAALGLAAAALIGVIW